MRWWTAFWPNWRRSLELDDWIEDAELNRIADARADEPDIDVDGDDE